MKTRNLAADDALTPLGPVEDSLKLPEHVSPLAIASFSLVALLMGLIGWVAVAGDPKAGEPVAVLALSTPESLDDGDYEVLMAASGVPMPLPKPQWIVAAAKNAESIAAQALPMHAFARPFPADDTRPRIALVMRGMGLSSSSTQLALDLLPADVTLSFVPYPNNLESWASEARQKGHEIILELPMEPFDYPENDPGPYTLLTGIEPAENAARLQWLLGRFTGYVGVTNYLGSKFMRDSDSLRPVLDTLQRKGVLFLDDGSSQKALLRNISEQNGLVWSFADRELTFASDNAVELDLQDLENLAERNGYAIGTGFAFPVTIERIAEWASTLERRGIVLAPLTAVVVPSPQS